MRTGQEGAKLYKEAVKQAWVTLLVAVQLPAVLPRTLSTRPGVLWLRPTLYNSLAYPLLTVLFYATLGYATY